MKMKKYRWRGWTRRISRSLSDFPSLSLLGNDYAAPHVPKHCTRTHRYFASLARYSTLRNLHHWGSGCPAHSPAQNPSQIQCPEKTGDEMDESRSPSGQCHLQHAGKQTSFLSAIGQGSVPILHVAFFPSVLPVQHTNIKAQTLLGFS